MKNTLIKAGWIITMDSENTVIQNGCIEIEDDYITNLSCNTPTDKVKGYDLIIDASDRIVMPGLIDIHTHVCGCLFKGMLEDSPEGFYKKALPMEDRLTASSAYALSMLGASECLLGGITTIQDLYHYMGSTAEAIRTLGMRGILATKVYETDLKRIQYNDYTRDFAAGQRRLADNIDLIEKYHQTENGRILCKMGPHATDTVSIELAKQIAALSQQYRVGCHIHVAQMPQEIAFLRETYGISPVEYLIETGLMRPDTTVAHCLHVTNSDIALLANGGVMLAHCPDMNGNKSGPIAPMREMYGAGVGISYGTDWISHDMWSTMRMGIAIGRLWGTDPNERTAIDALRRCTIIPAKHLGLDKLIGSLEIGKKADLIMLKTNHPNLCLINDNPIGAVVYYANTHDVDTVMVDGRILVQNSSLCSVSLSDVVKEGVSAAKAIQRNP